MKKWVLRVGFIALLVGGFAVANSDLLNAGPSKYRTGVCAGLQRAIDQQCELIKQGKGSQKAVDNLLDAAKRQGCKVEGCGISDKF